MKKKYLMIIMSAVLFFDTGSINAQNISETNSFRNELNQGDSLKMLDYNEAYRLPPTLSDKNILSNPSGNFEREITLPKFKINQVSNFYIDHETVRLAPYHYSFQNPMEGLIIQGVSGRFVLTDFLTANVNYYVSSTYFGEFQPNPYINNSLKMDVVLKLHDRVQLLGFGQVSVREGINPMIPSSLGGSNYYGAGILFKITDKIGIGFRVRNSYYRNNWTVRTDFLPVFY